MQTFLPYNDLDKISKCLDSRRLWKQVLEAKQILKVLKGESKGYQHHPIVKMWKGNEGGLKVYLACMLNEWLDRRFSGLDIKGYVYVVPFKLPEWTKSKELINSHRANLYFKDKEHYAQFKGEYDRAKKDEKGKPDYVWREE